MSIPPLTASHSFLGYKSFKDFENERDAQKKIFDDTVHCDLTYFRLFHHPTFKKIQSKEEITPLFHSAYFDVVDEYKIIPSSKGSLVARNLLSSFAICIKGEDKYSKPFIGLKCTSHLMYLESVIQYLKSQMIEKGCLEETLKIFILGGKIVSENPGENNLSYFTQALKLSVQCKIIKAMRFNHSLDPHKSFHVLFTAKKTYYTTKCFFDSLPIISDGKPPSSSDIEDEIPGRIYHQVENFSIDSKRKLNLPQAPKKRRRIEFPKT
jgi:hypothetical protein